MRRAVSTMLFGKIKDGADQFVGVERLGDVQLIARFEDASAVFGARISRQRYRRHVAQRRFRAARAEDGR